MVNEQMRENWTEWALGWVENEAIFDAVFSPITAAVLDAANVGRGDRLLDVGCGSGTLLAAASAAGADPVGIDISPGMAQAARDRVPTATVLVGDAQTEDLLSLAPGAAFDRVVSRFGVMFFADPAAAFANIGSASATGARMTFACWRTRSENPMFSLGSDVLTARLDPPSSPQEPGDPGPTAFADPDRLRRLLTEGGWSSVRIDALDTELDYGYAGTDGVEERLATVLATTTGGMARRELLPRLGAEGWDDLLDETRDAIRTAITDGAVRMPAAVWLVTARTGGS